jgi:hypothetical protein
MRVAAMRMAMLGQDGGGSTFLALGGAVWL